MNSIFLRNAEMKNFSFPCQSNGIVPRIAAFHHERTALISFKEKKPLEKLRTYNNFSEKNMINDKHESRISVQEGTTTEIHEFPYFRRHVENMNFRQENETTTEIHEFPYFRRNVENMNFRIGNETTN